MFSPKLGNSRLLTCCNSETTCASYNATSAVWWQVHFDSNFLEFSELKLADDTDEVLSATAVVRTGSKRRYVRERQADWFVHV